MWNSIHIHVSYFKYSRNYVYKQPHRRLPQAPDRFDLLPRAVVVHWKPSDSPGTRAISDKAQHSGNTKELKSTKHIRDRHQFLEIVETRGRRWDFSK